MRLVWLFVVMLLAVPAATVTAQDAPEARVTDAGVELNFQDAELRVVLSALAELGGLNLLYADIPSRLVTLRTSSPVADSDMRGFIESLAEVNGLHISDERGLIRIGAVDPTVVPPSETGPQQARNASDAARIFVYRLRHAQAGQLAQTLTAIFGGTSAGAAQTGSLSRQGLASELRDGRFDPLAQQDPAVPGTGARSVTTAQVILGQLIGPVRIVPDAPTNSLLIHATPADYGIVESAIEELDNRPLQVLIEVLIAEVRRDKSLAIGVGGTFSSITDNGTISGQLSGLSNGDFALRILREGDFSIDAVLGALSRTSDVSVLSRPVVIAQNNEEARILVGTQQPFIQLSRSLPTDNAVRDQVVQYKDVGTQLTIRPTINPDGYVSLSVLQEVSTATNEIQFDAPVISNREAATRLLVKDGHTAVLGGLVESGKQWSKSGVPILKDIPILGALFSSTQSDDRTTELFLFLTPHVLRDDAEIEAATEQIRDAASLLSDALDEPIPLLRKPAATADPSEPPGPSSSQNQDSSAEDSGTADTDQEVPGL